MKIVRSLKTQLTLWFVLLASIPLLVVGMLTTYYLSGTTESEILRRNQLLAQSTASEVGRFLYEPLHALEEFGDNFLLNKDFSEAWFLKYVDNFMDHHNYFQTVRVLNKKGIVHFVAPFNIDLVGIDMSKRDFFVEARKHMAPHWSHSMISLQTGLPVTYISIPYSEYTVVGSLNLISLMDIIGTSQVSEKGYVAIADERGTIIAHKDWQRVLQQEQLRQLDVLRDLVEKKGSSVRYVLDGVEMLASAVSVPYTDWIVVVAQPVEEVFGNIIYIRNVIIVAVILAIALAVLISTLSLERILIPIRKLVKGTGKVAEGIYDVSELGELAGSYQEVEELAFSFEAMSEALQNREQVLRESEERYKNLFSSIRDVIIVADKERTILNANQPALRNLFGYEIDEIKGKNTRVIYATDESFAYAGNEVFDKDEQVKGRLLETEFRKKDGTVFKGEVFALKLLDSNGEIRGNIGMIRDITDRQKLEEQLIHAQKMEAVGQLAGGVAHDFNNILTTIIGYASLLQMKMSPEDQLRNNVESILSASERAATLTKSLLAYSRKQIMLPKPIDINTILSKMRNFLFRIIGEDIKLETDFANASFTVNADQGQIEQAIMNLATNARDAMPEGGILKITTELARMDRDFIEKNGYGEEGDYVLVSIEDTGLGIDQEMLGRIFEPFFTTKEVGKGTGLGLAMVYGIVKQHNGFIDVESEEGKGTAFRIYLPLSEREIFPEFHIEEAKIQRGTETVLIAEDEEIVRGLNKEILENAGYRVIEAADGDEAVEQFMKHRDEISICLIDVVMPGKNGKEVYDDLRGVNKNIKVVFISGYNEELIQAKGILSEGIRFIYKPVPPHVLLNTIREILDLPDVRPS